jgi:acyl carrier protein
MEQDIRTILTKYARLSVEVTALERNSSLYDAGMTSHATVNVMLALENEFDIEFPERMLRRGVFESIASILAAVKELADVHVTNEQLLAG